MGEESNMEEEEETNLATFKINCIPSSSSNCHLCRSYFPLSWYHYSLIF